MLLAATILDSTALDHVTCGGGASTPKGQWSADEVGF